MRGVPSIIVACLVSACGAESKAEPSMVPTLEKLRPAIGCFDTAQKEEEFKRCFVEAGISTEARIPRDPRTAEDFAAGVAMSWLVLARSVSEPLSSQQFDAAIAYAKCVEQSTLALKGLRVEGNPRDAMGMGKGLAEMGCSAHAVSSSSMWARYPGLRGAPPAELKANLLATLFGSAAYGYIIEAKGWVSDEMRPCVRYFDGRTSPGCAHQPAQTAPAVPLGYAEQ